MSKKHAIAPFGAPKADTPDIEHIRSYFDLFRNDSDAIADEQCNDLNLEELFVYADRCLTPIGEMLLYCKLRRIAKSDDTDIREELITRIGGDGDFRKQIEGALSGLADSSARAMCNLLHPSINRSKWHPYFRFLPAVYIVSTGLAWLFATPSVLLIICACILLCNSFIHYWNKSYVETCIRPLGQLNKIRTAALELLETDRFNCSERLGESLDEIGRLGKRVGLFGLNRFMESDFTLPLILLIDLLKIVTLVEPIATHTLSKSIGRVGVHAKRAIDYLGEWDVLYSVASLRLWMQQTGGTWSLPSFTAPSGTLSANNMLHPLIADCVPNSIAIDKSVIITGSNMSGKSSFLKTIGVNIVASYAINTCFAERLVLPNCRLHTVLSVSDDISSGQSYYYSEARRIKSIIDRCSDAPSGSTQIVLIDEIFKGTNTIERISIAHAVLKYFVSLDNTLAIISTHDIELARSFSSLLSTYHFSEEAARDELRFNYRLLPGVEYTRNAISLLRLCDYPEELVACAERNARKIGQSMEAITLQ